MTGWVIVVDVARDLPNEETPHKVITTRQYLTRPQLFAGQGHKVINLSRSYAYLSGGYYASLLAEARGHRVIPSTQTMLELGRKALYAAALPDLEDQLNRRLAKVKERPEGPLKILICFGLVEDPRFEGFARYLFDWFRAPILEIEIVPGEWTRIRRIALVTADELNVDGHRFLLAALDRHTRRQWRSPRARTMARWSLAVLYDPKEALPPSKLASLKHFARVAEKLDVEVEPIQKRDLDRLAEFDALFIRETTALDNHTYRFARRAAQEGMPTIDDPESIIRCTNKVYLNELLAAHAVPTPATRVVDNVRELPQIAESLGYPIVLKIPDGSFSRGVFRAQTPDELTTITRRLLDDSDLILAQEFMPTEFDWRVGVLDGEPLFVCQYLMAKKHWQIVRHDADGRATEGRFRTFAIEDAPREVVDTAVRAARLIGHGLYGVDLKQNERGVFVIEINDNPNLDHGIEDAVLKDELWRRLTRWFLDRLTPRE